jgi:hypothetical protein
VLVAQVYVCDRKNPKRFGSTRASSSSRSIAFAEPGMRDGLLSGAVTSAAVGLLLCLTDLAAMPGVTLVMALVGATFGSWAASLVAVRIPNRQLKAFEKDLGDGRILLVVDVPNERVEEVTELVTSRLPEADARGADPRMPAYCA